MRSLRSVAAAATLLALVAGLAGCGGDDDKSSDDSDDPVTATVTEDPSTDATDATSEPTDATEPPPMDPTGEEITQEQVDAALLTAAEVGPDFVDGAYTESSDPLPCDPDGAPIEEQVPSTVSGGAQIEHSSGEAAVIEEITIYATEAEAAEAFGIGTAGLSCTDGTLPDGSAITLEAPQDLTAEVNTSGIGTTTAWAFSTEEIDGAFVATLAGRVIVSTSFQALNTADTSGLPSPADVAADAFAKALAN